MPYLAQSSKEQGASLKIQKGTGSRQMVILEQGAQKMLKRSMEQEKNPGGKKKNEKGAVSREK